MGEKNAGLDFRIVEFSAIPYRDSTQAYEETVTILGLGQISMLLGLKLYFSPVLMLNISDILHIVSKTSIDISTNSNSSFWTSDTNRQTSTKIL